MLSHFTAGAVGAADGWFFVVSGILLGPAENLSLIAAAAFLCGIFSLFVFTIQRVKNGRYAGRDTLPFLPFAALAALLLYAAGFL